MVTAPKTALLAVSDSETRLAIRWWLSREGFKVRSATAFDAALRMAPGDLLVTDLRFSAGTGFDLLRSFRQRGFSPWTLVLAPALGPDEVHEAMGLGVGGHLNLPLDQEQFSTAIRGFHQRRDQVPTFVSKFETGNEAVAQAPRDLAAFALRCGIGPACRARIAGVCAELVENVAQHAYPAGSGAVEVHASFEERELRLVVSDHGIGLDPVLVSTDSMSSGLDGGLARSTSLSEDLQIRSEPGQGTTVRATFTSSSVQFTDEESVDLSDLDYLDPATARRVLQSLQHKPMADVYHLSPALAVIIGRLLVGPDPRRALQMAIRS